MVYVVTGAFILLDMITGVVKAFKEKNFTSSVMREGLFHKGGSIITIVFASLVDFASRYVDLGVTTSLAPIVCTYIILMEVGSIIENVGKINPQILPKKLRSYFLKLTDKEE